MSRLKGLKQKLKNRDAVLSTTIANIAWSGLAQKIAGHENSKTTMDIYAKVKYNKPEELLSVVNSAFKQ